jgi:MerR family mercuric resistance operon transcriptional regulator
MTTMTIGGLARAAGVNIETVRYYERRGLLSAPERSRAGYRQYGDDALWRLQFVARAKRLGFTLSEIAELLAADGSRGVDDVLGAANAKLTAVEAQLGELATKRDRLRQLVRACEDGDDGDCVSLAAADD